MGAMKFGQMAETQDTGLAARGMRFLRKDFLVRYLPLVVMLIVLVYMAFTVEHFMTERNLINILRQASALAIMAIGMTAVLITGGIDLSIPSTMAFGGIRRDHMRDGRSGRRISHHDRSVRGGRRQWHRGRVAE